MQSPSPQLSPGSRNSRLLPREKLALMGVSNLTEVELVALLLGSGTQKLPLMQLAEKTWQHIKNRQITARSSSPTPDWLESLAGIGKAKASALVAALELSQRLHALLAPPQVVNPSIAFQLAGKIRQSLKEQVLALFLDGQQRLLETQLIAVGGKNFAFLDPATIFHSALKLPAAGIILIHNHPSGSLEPSDNDLRLTVRLKAGAELLSIEFLDHLIVSKTGYFSLREHGLITDAARPT